MGKKLVGFRPSDEELEMIKKLKWLMMEQSPFYIKITDSDVLRACLRELYRESFCDDNNEDN